MIKTIVDSSLFIDIEELSRQTLKEIQDRLSVPNPAKKRAEREMLYNAENLPECIELWKFDGNTLTLPRGFLPELEEIVDIELIDNRSKLSWIRHSYKVAIDRQYQEEAYGKLWFEEQGIYKAPTASGKTRVMLELIRRRQYKTIVICEKKDIAQQWIKAAEDLEFESVGYIGESICQDDRNLVIALRQSLWAADFAQEWFNMWGMVVVDEVHHLNSAETLINLVQRFPAPYRYGCSATPDSDSELFPIARAVIGPVVAESKLEEIREHLVIPSVRVIETEFTYPYRPTFRRKDGYVVRNNYNDMMKTLEEDSDRNSLIMGAVLNEALNGHHCLIISKRKNHLEEIFNHYPEECMWIWENNKPKYITEWFKLTGDNSYESAEIAQKIDECEIGTITFTTLADEGTDVPRWDRLFLAYPGRKLRGYEQSIGRIMRPHPKKKDAIVYDFRDSNVSLLNSQYRDRAQRIYAKKGYKVEQSILG